jgi:hypothetical protein
MKVIFSRLKPTIGSDGFNYYFLPIFSKDIIKYWFWVNNLSVGNLEVEYNSAYHLYDITCSVAGMTTDVAIEWIKRLAEDTGIKVIWINKSWRWVGNGDDAVIKHDRIRFMIVAEDE